ncbi:unnamed protein product [Choristocarpus tenellus]
MAAEVPLSKDMLDIVVRSLPPGFKFHRSRRKRLGRVYELVIAICREGDSHLIEWTSQSLRKKKSKRGRDYDGKRVFLGKLDDEDWLAGCYLVAFRHNSGATITMKS